MAPASAWLLEAVRFGQVQDALEAIGAGADVNARDFQKRPALWVAASEGHLEIMELLLRHGADVTLVLGVASSLCCTGPLRTVRSAWRRCC